jgi:DNA repair protein RadC
MKIYKNNATKFKLVKEPSTMPKAKITSSKDIAEYMIDYVYEEDIEVYESMYAVFMNRSNNIESVQKLSQGGTSGTVIDIKLLGKYALDCLASHYILVHNHPSGNIAPSKADKTITEKVMKALALFDITLVDHIILVPGGNYYSFADNCNL